LVLQEVQLFGFVLDWTEVASLGAPAQPIAIGSVLGKALMTSAVLSGISILRDVEKTGDESSGAPSRNRAASAAVSSSAPKPSSDQWVSPKGKPILVLRGKQFAPNSPEAKIAARITDVYTSRGHLSLDFTKGQMPGGSQPATADAKTDSKAPTLVVPVPSPTQPPSLGSVRRPASSPVSPTSTGSTSGEGARTPSRLLTLGAAPTPSATRVPSSGRSSFGVELVHQPSPEVLDLDNVTLDRFLERHRLEVEKDAKGDQKAAADQV
jgi:hypothetical protein